MVLKVDLRPLFSGNYSGERPQISPNRMKFHISVVFVLIRWKFPEIALLNINEVRWCPPHHSDVNIWITYFQCGPYMEEYYKFKWNIHLEGRYTNFSLHVCFRLLLVISFNNKQLDTTRTPSIVQAGTGFMISKTDKKKR